VNPTISCLAMVFLVGGEEAKSELSCCGMKTHEICWNRASTWHRRKLQVMGFPLVVLVSNKLSVQLPKFVDKFRVWILAFWPKFPILDLKTTSFPSYLWHKATNFEKILTLTSAHRAPTRSPTIALPIHRRKLDEIGYKTSGWPTDDWIWITSCALDAFDHWFGGPKITRDLLILCAKKIGPSPT
jgi:hypothetical protein